VGPGPYGPLQSYDANGIALPAGFTSREIARGGIPVEGSAPPYVWHLATDGQATFSSLGADGAPDGGWILVANSEMPDAGAGGVSAVRFAPDGAVVRAYRILAGTTHNCAGGPTPWGTWLSCEEHGQGRVWECDPTGVSPAEVRPAMGIFSHEAAAVDPDREVVYLTEDDWDGCLYRFRPDVYPDLSSGLLEVAVVSSGGEVAWEEVPNPQGGTSAPTRRQVTGAAHFSRGEGIWYDDGKAYFTTTGDDRVWLFDATASKIDVLYDRAAVGPGAPLSGVDNITVAPTGDIYVCEDGADHDICLITPNFEISRFLRLDPSVHDPNNELVGVVFSPDGSRMYFGAQRSFGVPGSDPYFPAGAVYEISRGFPPPAGAPGDSPAAAINLRVGAPGHARIPRLLRRGLTIDVEMDAPAGLRATLRVPRAGRRRGSVTIADVNPSVALHGPVKPRLAPNADARRLLRGRERVEATLEVTATGEFETAVARRRVGLRRHTD
jgi:uncharacterized protein